jgi:death on curing protein
MRYFERYRGYKYPTEAFILNLHTQILQESGGREGLNNPGVIASAVNKPHQSVGGEDAYSTLFTKVAAIGLTLAHDHPFSDGNKRTAYTVMLATLEANTYYPQPSEREAATVMVLVAMGLLGIAGLRIALMMWCGIDPSDAAA